MRPPLPGPRYFNPFSLVRSLTYPTELMLRARDRYGDTYRLLDWTLPAGTDVVASVIMLHNRADLHPEPTRFRPSRFLDRKLTPFEYLPFGGGARRCIGAAFALHEMKIVLATILRSHRLRLVNPAKVSSVRRGGTMGPSGGIPMIYDGARGA